MAIVLPILLVLLLSIWQLSVVYGTWQSLRNAASDGARAGAAAPPRTPPGRRPCGRQGSGRRRRV